MILMNLVRYNNNNNNNKFYNNKFCINIIKIYVSQSKRARDMGVVKAWMEDHPYDFDEPGLL